MGDQNLPDNYTERAELVLPQFGPSPPTVLNITKIKEGEKRLVEARVVNGGTYSDLEYVFNEGYREAKTHLSVVGYLITQAQKSLRQAQSEALMDQYPGFLKESKLKDSASLKDAFLFKQEDYNKAQDRIDILKATECFLEGKIKVFERVCAYMKKEIDIQIRSGMDCNKYTNRR